METDSICFEKLPTTSVRHGRGGGIRTRDPLLCKLRYQAALRPDKAHYTNISWLRSPFKRKFCRNPALCCAKWRECFAILHATIGLLGTATGITGSAIATPATMIAIVRLFGFQPVTCAGNGKTLFIQQRANLADQQHFVVLVVAPVAAPLDRLSWVKFLLPSSAVHAA